MPAKHLVDKAALSIDDQLKQLQIKKDNIVKLFDIEISKLSLQQNAVKSEQNALSSEEKESKMREKLVQEVLKDKSGRYNASDIDSLIPVEPEAQGQALLSLGK